MGLATGVVERSDRDQSAPAGFGHRVPEALVVPRRVRDDVAGDELVVELPEGQLVPLAIEVANHGRADLDQGERLGPRLPLLPGSTVDQRRHEFPLCRFLLRAPPGVEPGRGSSARRMPPNASEVLSVAN